MPKFTAEEIAQWTTRGDWGQVDGKEMRVTARNGRVFEGQLCAEDPEWLLVNVGEDDCGICAEVHMPPSAISTLEMLD